jgi:lysyl-tRNA synthetase class 2
MSDKNLAELHTRYFPCTPVVLDGHKFDDLLNRCLEPICAHSLTCVLDYPKFDPCFGNESPTGHIERFEIFLDGIEIANGYQEIQSRESFLERFRFENRQRHLLGLARLPEPAVSDIPSCSGVAVGLDRLIAITGGYESIHEGGNREDSVFNPDWLHA